MAYESTAVKLADAPISPGFQVCEKLRPPIGKVLGVTGFKMLLSRALALASRTHPTLQLVHIRDDGSLERVGEKKANQHMHAVDEAEVALIAQLFALLTNFIGTELTLRLLIEVWPELKTLEFGEDNQNEEK